MWTWKFKTAAAAAAAIFAAGSLLYAYSSGKEMGAAEVQTLWDRDRIATAEAHAKEIERMRQKEAELEAERQKVEATYAQQKRDAARAAAGAQSELDRLRDELAAAPGGGSCAGAGTPGRIDGAARLEQELLGHCAATLTQLAGEADRLEAVIVGLQAYVRDVCLAR